MYRKELSYYFSTPIAYIAIALYLLTISLVLWVVPGRWNIIDSGYAQADGLFWLSPWLLLLLCPALTMRLFAEERQSGTWDVLRTKPISLTRIVLGKYFAAWTVVILAQLPCLIHFAAISALAEPAGNIDHGALLGGFIGLILVSAMLTAVGTWASTLSLSQIVCFLLAFVVGLLIMLACRLIDPATLQSGVLALQDIVLYLSIGILFIVLAIGRLSRL
ncbi:MAG: gliding motility-associated ABC transporter permease subunit GldF [Bacteroidales bacterium]|jgi:ABC-2 type transport system permease protein|nr:gliding motility-associated ABC transporter permease subunit GldF [Bacteroidales bacterium]